MAIYQYNMTPIPLKGLKEKFTAIPQTLHVDYDERRRHDKLKKNGQAIQEENFRDALTQNWWGTVELAPRILLTEIDSLVKRSTMGNGKTDFYWKTYTETVDNDAALHLAEDTGKITTVNFRADLREPGLVYLKAVIKLAQKYQWMLMDVKGRLAAPNRKAVKQLILRSNAYRFVSNPTQFFEELENGTIEIE